MEGTYLSLLPRDILNLLKLYHCDYQVEILPGVRHETMGDVIGDHGLNRIGLTFPSGAVIEIPFVFQWSIADSMTEFIEHIAREHVGTTYRTGRVTLIYAGKGMLSIHGYLFFIPLCTDLVEALLAVSRR